MTVQINAGPNTIDVAMQPVAGLVISNVIASQITDTGAMISWDLSDYGTGQVEYGPTTAYGQFSTLENSFIYKHHDQILSGLTTGTLYHFRVHSKNQAGIESISSDYTFTTTGGGPPPPTGIQFAAYLYGISSSTPLTGPTIGIAEVVVPDASMNYSTLNDGSPLSSLAAIAQRCHAAGIPCILSVFAGFSDEAQNAVYTEPVLSQTIVNNVAKTIRDYGLDGLDWDWECDTKPRGQGIKPQKTALMQAFRAALGPSAIITITQNWPHGSAGVTYEPAVLNYIDYVQIMSYDDSSIVYMTVNEISQAVNLWVAGGFPKSALIIGIPFQTYQAINSTTWNGRYASVIASYNPAPSANNADGAYYNGYDLVLQKAQWVKSQGLAGCFAYNYVADAFGDSRSLTAAIRQGLGV